MSIFTDKRVFGIKRKNSSGIATAGQVCANDVILWVIFLLPINIVLHGAGQCFVAIGLFAGNVVGWIFLSKRMNSYVEFSKKKIHNAPELFAARYDSWILKDLVSVVWIVTLGAILVSVLRVIVSVVAYFMDMDESLCLVAITVCLVLATILVDNRFMGIIKTVVFILVICVCLAMIGLIFYRIDVYELLDNYRRSRLSGGTSIYLNIMYYDGEHISVGSAVSMAGVGLGCIAMPLMYKGVINIRDVKELDAGRIWAIVFEGLTILSSCVLAMLVVPVLYPERVYSGMNSFQVYNMLLKKLLGSGTVAYAARFFMLMVFVLAVVVMMESLMRNICEHMRGMVPPVFKDHSYVKLLVDIGVVVITGIALFFVAECSKYNREMMIVHSWGLCAAALAAPLMFTLMYRNSTRSGMFAGIISGIIAYFLWQYLPIIDNGSLSEYFSLSGDVPGFLVSALFCLVVSAATDKNSEDELKVFDRMMADQS